MTILVGEQNISGCGVVVAQEPSKLLGPVRTWSAAPKITLLRFIKNQKPVLVVIKYKNLLCIVIRKLSKNEH